LPEGLLFGRFFSEKPVKMKKAGIFIIFCLPLAVDSIAKFYMQNHPNFYLGGFAELKLFRNTEFYFFSFGSYTNLIISLISGAVLIIFIFLFFKYLKVKNVLLLSGFLLVISGGVSNLFDRLYYGYVIDFIKIFILPISIFNLADILVISGTALIILSLFGVAGGRFSGIMKTAQRFFVNFC